MRFTVSAAIGVSLLISAACDDPNTKPVTMDPDPVNTDDGGVDAGPVAPNCCAAGEACAPGLLPCPTECPDGTLCPAEQRCAQTSDGAAYACSEASDCRIPCGTLCCANGASCAADACVTGDLALEATAPAPEAFVRLDVAADDCRIYDGCFTGSGRRALIQLDVKVKNVGAAPVELGEPWRNDAFHASLCQSAYVLDDFIEARVLDQNGKAVSKGRLATRCVAAESGGYTCSLQGLMPGESSAQPNGGCNFVDVTGLVQGDYQLELTVNPRHVVAEANFDNNRLVLPLAYPDCDGTMCGGTCCPGNAVCHEGQCLLPDLRMNGPVAQQSLFLTHITAETNSCELQEMCVTGSGERRVLQFEARVENWGPGDLNPGAEQDNPLFEFSPCHGHHHFLDFSDYKLLKPDGSVAAQGHKQSFCLINMDTVDGADVPAAPGLHPEPGDTGCSYLSAGWADIYGVGTQCQWIDVTGVEPGDYVMRIAVNPIGKIAEHDVTNNVVEIPVHIPADTACNGQREICGNAVDEDCDQMPDYYDDDCVSSPNEEIAAGNDTCATAHALGNATHYRSTLEQATRHDTALSCGEAAGGQAFYALTLASDEIVYLDSLASEMDTVLAVLPAGCSGAAVACESGACGIQAGQFAGKLAAGSYVVVVQAREAGATGRMRLRAVRSGVSSATRITRPGLFEGDTSDAADSVDVACGFGGGWDGDFGDGDFHDGIAEEEPHEHAPPGPMEPGVDEGVAGNDVPDGADDVYFLAHCGGATLHATTCGTAAYDSALAYYEGSVAQAAGVCTYESNSCTSDPNGAALTAYLGEPGVSFLVVDSADGVAEGAYQLQVSY
jgi:hypothetical protein